MWPGYRLIVAGNPGQGKTTFVAALGRAVAHEEVFLDMPGCGGTVIFLDTEMGLRSVQKALTKAKLDESDMVRYIRIPDGLELDTSAEQLRWLVELVETHRPVMVVIDPLYKAHGGDSNDERQMIGLMRRLDKIRDEYGFALAIPMHLRKTDPKTPDPGLNDVFGSGAFTRGPEVVISIRRVHPGRSRLGWLKDRDGEMSGSDAWNLDYTADDGFTRSKDDAEKPMNEQIAGAYLAAGSGAMTLKELAAATGKTERTLRDHLKGMIQDGLVSQTEKLGPHGVKMYVMDYLPPAMEEDPDA